MNEMTTLSYVLRVTYGVFHVSSTKLKLTTYMKQMTFVIIW